MPDPTNPQGPTPGPGGDPYADISRLQSRFREMQADLARAATYGQDAFQEAFRRIRTEIDNTVIPAISGLRDAPKEGVRALHTYEKSFRDLGKTAAEYYKVVETREQSQVRTVLDRVAKERRVVEAFYADQIKLTERLENAEERVAQQRYLQAQQRKDLSRAGIGALQDVGGRTLGFLGAGAGIAGASSLFSMLDNLFVAQTRAMGTVGRITGAPGEAADRGTSGQMFAGIESASLGAQQRLELMNKSLREAPRLLGQTVSPLIGFLAQFGVDANESMQLATLGSSTLNASVEQLVDTLAVSAGAAQEYGFDVLMTTDMTLKFAAALRQTGMDTDLAIKRAQQYAVAIEDVATQQNLSVTEMQTLASRLSSTIQAMPVERAAGLFTFMEGAMPTTLDQLERVGDPQFLAGFFDRMEQMAGPAGALFAPTAAAQALGLGSLSPQQAKAFRELMRGFEGTQDELMDELRTAGLSNIQTDVRLATRDLRNMAPALDQIKNLLQGWGTRVMEPIGNITRNPLFLSAITAGGAAQIAGGAAQSLNSLLTLTGFIGPVGRGASMVGKLGLGAVGLAAAGGAVAAYHSPRAAEDRRDISTFR